MDKVKNAREFANCAIGLDAEHVFHSQRIENLTQWFERAILQGIELGVEACAHKCWQGNCNGKWASPEDFRTLKAVDILIEQRKE